MDYPKSIPGVGLVDGRFVDENPIAGTPGSLIPAVWGNAVTEEVRNVLLAAGIAPVEGLNTQLLAALRSKGLFETPVQFDASKQVATTEFVQRALGSYSGQTNYAGDVTLSAADVGKLTIMTATGVVTLPEWSTVPPGGLVTVTGGAFTVRAKNGETLNAANGAPGPFSFLNGSTATFRRLLLGGGWGLDAGDGALKFSPVFSSVSSYNGYQKLPSGIIIQWGNVTTTNGVANVVFPTIFPNSLLRIIPSVAGASSVGTVYSASAAGGSTTSGVTVYCNAPITITIGYHAIGY